MICLMVFIGACNGDKPIEKPIVETDTGGTDTGGGVGKMYWTDEDTNEIFRANLDGSRCRSSLFRCRTSRRDFWHEIEHVWR